MTKSNYISNIASSVNNTNQNSINFNSYLKSENLHSLNKSNDLISPKNTFGSQNHFISTNRKLKDFVNLYSKKKFFRNSKVHLKPKEDTSNNNNIRGVSNLYTKKNNFLSENIFQNDSDKNIATHGNNYKPHGLKLKSVKYGNEKLFDFEKEL